MFTELYREEKREEGDNSGQEDKRGESKGKRQIQPVISSLSVLHCLKHTEIHRVGAGRVRARGLAEPGHVGGGPISRET